MAKHPCIHMCIYTPVEAAGSDQLPVLQQWWVVVVIAYSSRQPELSALNMWLPSANSQLYSYNAGNSSYREIGRFPDIN